MNWVKALAIDSNLLVLLVARLTSETIIDRHRRLQSYSVNDFKILVEWADSASVLIFTPNSLNEMSNLLRQTDAKTRSLLMETFRTLIGDQTEIYVRSIDVSDQWNIQASRPYRHGAVDDLRRNRFIDGGSPFVSHRTSCWPQCSKLQSSARTAVVRHGASNQVRGNNHT